MRQDIHRPSAINPEEYEFVAFNYTGGSDLGAIMALQAQRAIFRAHMEKTGGRFSNHEHGGVCHVCGAFCVYEVIWHHAGTNSYIVTGEDCARKMDMGYGDMNGFRRAIATAHEAHAGKKKAIAILGDMGLMMAWEIYVAEFPKHVEGCAWMVQDEVSGQYGQCSCGVREFERAFDQFEERTIRDIVGKLVKYGNISEKQEAFVKKLLDKILDRPVIEAQRQAEKDAAGPVPVGRNEMKGEVVGMKEVEGPAFSYHDDGVRTKLIIKLENGSKIYGNRFANLDKGDKVHFTAAVEASKDDPKFGFYKRPVVYQSPEQKKAVKKLYHACAALRVIQMSQGHDLNELEGINGAMTVLDKVRCQVEAGADIQVKVVAA